MALTVAVTRAFPTILADLQTQPLSQPILLQFLTQAHAAPRMSLPEQSNGVQAKKVKTLEMIDAEFKPKDVLFLNTLTPTKFRALGKKRGVPFHDTDSSDIINLKEMESQRCGLAVATTCN